MSLFTLGHHESSFFTYLVFHGVWVVKQHLKKQYQTFVPIVFDMLLCLCVCACRPIPRMLAERRVCTLSLSLTTCFSRHKWSLKTFRKTWIDSRKTWEVTHTHTQTHTNTHTHAHTHTNTHTQTLTHMHTHTHTNKQTHTLIGTHTCTQTHTYACAQRHTYSRKHTRPLHPHPPPIHTVSSLHSISLSHCGCWFTNGCWR